MEKSKNPIVIALYVNALLLAGILGSLLTSRLSGTSNSTVFAQNQPAIGGGAGIFVMPAQFASNLWGCYLLDVDTGTVVAYAYEPGVRKLTFVAARSYKNDRFLTDFGTAPPTEEVRAWVEKQRTVGKKADDKSGQNGVK